jgi:hypothetical protein
MGIKSLLSKTFAWWVVQKQKKWANNAAAIQHSILQTLLKEAKHTVFGKDHHFANISHYEDFKKYVPVRDYEGIRAYIERVKKGERDVLWKGLPKYFAKTSGTTSGVKYIPVSKESIFNHINGARDALLNYIFETGKTDFLNGKLIFLSGSPVLEKKNGIYIGRLSGIVNHHIPAYLKSNQMPSYSTNCIEDWEQKVEKIAEETFNQSMSLISGIPPWVQMYFDMLVKKSGKKIKDLFPHFSLFVYGGVNFEPYRNKLFETIGKSVDAIETYPASEGFIAFQNSQKDNGLLLLLNSGIFYEFIPADEYFVTSPTRLSIGEVKLGINYALIMSTNAGLWAYSIGDTVKFISKDPYRIIVTGRIKHFISAFGEHVIGEEVEKAMFSALEKYKDAIITEFTVAPQINPAEGLPHHEWLIEFASLPADLQGFKLVLNAELVKLNVYYKDLIEGKILSELKIVSLKEGAFREYMKSQGKLGGQNKVPRLSNDRVLADVLMSFKIK